MKWMAFLDLENLRKSVRKLDGDRFLNEATAAQTLYAHLVKHLTWEHHNPRFIRTYTYTGEYTDELIQKIKRFAGNNTHLAPQFNELIAQCEHNKDLQKAFLDKAAYFHFFELKLKPLKYLYPRKPNEVGRVVQKGVDVQLAVDLVHHAYNDSFDVALLSSGDLDLLESIRLVKNKGKKVVIVSHHQQMSPTLRKEADFFLSLTDLPLEVLDKLAPVRGTDTSQRHFSSPANKQ